MAFGGPCTVAGKGQAPCAFKAGAVFGVRADVQLQPGLPVCIALSPQWPHGTPALAAAGLHG